MTHSNPLTTTLNRIEACSKIKMLSGFALNRRPQMEVLLEKLGKSKADDEPLLYSTILEHTRLDTAILFLAAEEHEWFRLRTLAYEIAKPVKKLCSDERLKKVFKVTKQYLRGTATISDLDVAGRWAYQAEQEAIHRLNAIHCMEGRSRKWHKYSRYTAACHVASYLGRTDHAGAAYFVSRHVDNDLSGLGTWQEEKLRQTAIFLDIVGEA